MPAVPNRRAQALRRDLMAPPKVKSFANRLAYDTRPAPTLSEDVSHAHRHHRTQDPRDRDSGSVDLDGTGIYDVDTGIGFLGPHAGEFSRIRPSISKCGAQGDCIVDFHHPPKNTASPSGRRSGARSAISPASGGSARFRCDGRTLTQVASRYLQPPYSDLESQSPPQIRRDGHRIVPRCSRLWRKNAASACTSRIFTVRTAINRGDLLQRDRGGRCVRHPKSTSGWRAPVPSTKETPVGQIGV